MTQKTLLEVEGLKVSFKSTKGHLEVVHGVDFNVNESEILGIAGESGCGKSVSTLAILGLLSDNGYISGGKVSFNGNCISDLPETELSNIRGNDIAMIFQDSLTSLNPTMKIGRQLVEPLIVHEGLEMTRAKKRVIEMLENVGISSPEKRFGEYPHQLSGGMRQRVMIAMGLLLKPKLLIADEPTTALDVSIQAQILDLMKKLRDDFGTAIILITHDMGVIAEMADRVLIRYAGRVVESADVHSLFCKPKHPYTKGLLGSIPRLDQNVDRLYSIKGSVPNAENMPMGCAFAPRCPDKIKICETNIPNSFISNATRVACHLYNKEK